MRQMWYKAASKKILAVLTGLSLLFTSLGLPANTSLAEADAVTAVPEQTEIKNINLNTRQEDGSYVIAGISDPGQPYLSQIGADQARNNNWGEEKDADGTVIKSGSYVYYGNYQQSSNGDGSYNTEPLKWRILDADTQDFNAESDTAAHTMFLLSDKVLDQINFNESQKDGVNYSECNLRKWLNSEPFNGNYLEGGFLANAFSTSEQKAIAVSSKCKNDEIEIKTLVKDNCGLSQDGVTDQLFVLSAEEANSNVYGFYNLNGWGATNTRALTATEYAAAKEILSLEKDTKSWWLRSRATNSTISTGIVDHANWLWACNVDCMYSTGPARVGVAPAFNLKLSSVQFTSASGSDKSSSFTQTSDSDSQEWNLTMSGGSGFKASRNSSESGAVKQGGEVTVDITSMGTPENSVEYTQISAMLVDRKNTVAAYGKIADTDAEKAVITIPAEIPKGNYTLKVFAEEVNSASAQNMTDFASNMVNIPITVDDIYTVSIINPANSHITRSTTPENGTEKQGILKQGGSFAQVTYTADSGYYFPENYSAGEVNGITVTRNSFNQITVSGNPTADVGLTLTAATEKDSQAAPEGLREADRQITGTTSAMEYRIKPTDESSADSTWTDCTTNVTIVSPGIYQIRFQETETKKAGTVAEITVFQRYTVTITNPANSHIIRSDMPGNGTEQQKLTNGEAITSITYRAADGYYFPDDYYVTGQNGITVIRNSTSQITVSGIPTRDVILTLTAATAVPAAKPTPTGNPAATPTPTGQPSAKPTPAATPSTKPAPTGNPTATPTPTGQPAVKPTPAATPSTKPAPTGNPAAKPTPTGQPATQNPERTIPPTQAKSHVTWWKAARVDGYDIFAAPCGKKLNAKSRITTVKGKKTPTSLAKTAGKKLHGKKSYKVKIKAYKLADGKKIYIASSQTYHVASTKNKTYTNAKKIRLPKKSVILKKGKTRQIKATIVKQSPKKKLLPKSHGAPLRYQSTNAKIAAVTSKGKIHARKKGRCNIYVTALNGVSTRIKITVK